MRDIAQLRTLAKQKRIEKTPPVITGGATQIDLALDAAANSGDFSAVLPGLIPPGIAKQYIDEGYKIVSTKQGTIILFESEEL